MFLCVAGVRADLARRRVVHVTLRLRDWLQMTIEIANYNFRKVRRRSNIELHYNFHNVALSAFFPLMLQGLPWAG